MKILNICGYSWDIGGPPKIIYDHAVVQMKMGAEVTILTPISEGQKLYSIPEGANVVTCKRHWFSKFWAEFSPELYHWIKIHGNEYDIIHVHGVWHFAGVAPYLAGIKTAQCITTHGLLDRWTISKGYWKKYLFGLLFQKRILKNTELIQINNTDEQADLKRFLGFEHSNVKIIPNGMNLHDFAVLPEKNTFRNQFQIIKDKQLILFMSRINLKKGLDLLLPAFKQLMLQRNDCLLILAGPDDGYLTDTQKFIKENHLEDKIILVGMLIGKDKLALISGVPSLLSDRVGFGEAIKETNAAHLVELNERSILEGLNKMLDYKDYCKTLSKNGISLVKEKYDIELVAKQLYYEFEKIVKS
jgi:glycosyltransferase involved in cell wall biosynthesis